jgi:hypothetical protein
VVVHSIARSLLDEIADEGDGEAAA